MCGRGHDGQRGADFRDFLERFPLTRPRLLFLHPPPPLKPPSRNHPSDYHTISFLVPSTSIELLSLLLYVLPSLVPSYAYNAHRSLASASRIVCRKLRFCSTIWLCPTATATATANGCGQTLKKSVAKVYTNLRRLDPKWHEAPRTQPT